MPPDAPGGEDRPRRPEYRVYRSRPPLLERLRPTRPDRPRLPERPGREPRGPRGPRRPLLRRVLRWAAAVAAVWLLLSLAVFMVSAQTQDGVSERTERALSSGGSLATGSTILVLGSDQRPKGTKEPGAAGSPSRADSIMLLHVAFGSVRRLSILRDSFTQIPGAQPQKINAAYAIGGAALTIKTVEGFMGNDLEINHVIEVDFANFPELIDSLGGVDITLKRCLKSNRFGDKRVRLRRGKHHLSGREALRFARVRKNLCAPSEDDRARAARQQQVFASMRSKLVSPRHWPSTFVRLPWISWEAPRALRTDMRGPGLLALFGDLLTGGAGKTRVLRPSGLGPGGSLIVSEETRADAVRELTGG